MRNAGPDIEYVREWLAYDADTGVLTWRKQGHGPHQRPDKPTGTTNSHGYRVVRLQDRLYMAHRVIWLLVHGEWPGRVIDHINGNRTDNRLVNLRHVSNQVNMQNQKRAPRNSSSGILGASWSPERKKWQAGIVMHGKRIALGRFDSAEAAHAAYLSAKRALHEGNTL